MEGTEHAVCTSSGMSAIACCLMQLCKQGDHIVSSDTIYGGTFALLNDLLPQYGITTTFVDPTDTRAFERAITPTTRVLYTEAMGNPTLKMADIPGLSALATGNDLSLVVDNTFTPMLISPAQLGADVVVYSLTKYINGASDLVAGAICTTKELIHRLMDLHTGRAMLLGPTMDPRMAYDIIQRLPHLAIRMREHSRRAMAVSERLEALGADIVYPGLASFSQHKMATEMINRGYGYGGMFTVDCGSRDRADALLDELQNTEDFGYIAVSLGYFDTLMSCSGASTSSEIGPEEQKKMGLSPGLVRLSIGYTGSIDQRIQQIERAVRKVGLAAS
jgi:methionine-gamma-lyase